MPKQKTSTFRFRSLDNIGAAAAEDDKFLRECFIDTGALEFLRHSKDPRCVITGRTGSGKTALIMQLRQTEERVIEIPPESLALSYVSNSTILRFLSGIGVKLDIFFRLLWRHVFTVELLKHHFEIHGEEHKASFLTRFLQMFSGQESRKALNYLETWGRSFWQETEYRIKEVTQTLERDLKASIGSTISKLGVSISADGGKKLTSEERAEIVDRAQRVVNQVQIRELSEIIDMIDRVLDDPQKRYFIVLDRLDENWVEESLRYRLIRALIETTRDFRKVRNAKIVLALRLDLLDRVFRLTRDPGFQEEKYESLYLPLQWVNSQLIEVLDRRVDHLVRHQYTKQTVTHKDVFPVRIGRQETMAYLLERTFMRPRDVIMFFNECIKKAVDKPRITASMLSDAEGEYSRNRLRSLGDEWSADYPTLLSFTGLFRNRRPYVRLNEISNEEIAELCLEVCVSSAEADDELSVAAAQVVECRPGAVDHFRRVVAVTFYKAGLLGLKTGPTEGYAWALSGRRSISFAEIGPSTSVAIHPMFWRVLGVDRRQPK